VAKPKARGGPPSQNFANNFQPIAPEQAWHPRRGAPPGNRNAQTHGVRAREMEAMRKYARDLIRASNAALAAFHAERKRRLAELPPAP
jgi:hypothetical protein